jgi:SHS2 domain-containing protein
LTLRTQKAEEAIDVLEPGYKFLPHTTDAYIESIGATFEAALENAGLALFDTMCDLRSITHARQDVIAAEGADDLELLYNWLESLLLKFELERRVYSKFQVSLMREPQALRLKAHAYGEIFDRKKHGPKVEVKAVTYHRMEISHQVGLVFLRFILDL